MLGLTIACAVACAVLVYAEWRAPRLRPPAKIAASLAFLGVGLLAASPSWVTLGLALGVVGDVALLGKGERAFLAGLGAFLVAHLAYVVGIAQLSPPQRWIAPAMLLPVAVAAAALWRLWPRLGAMKLPVTVYVLAIVAMVAGALSTGRPRLAVGAVLFFASDLSVARDKFEASTFANKAWGLPAYYAGQLLIAWSLA